MQETNSQANEAAEICESKSNIVYLFTKRTFDIISSLCAIVIFSPLLLVIVVSVKLDSKGLAIFKHKRIGMYGEDLGIYKFRTMVTNAEELLKKLTPEQKKEYLLNFKLENDPRITKLGNFLRKTSLDELPQLFNIFIGNMSVVGPRPVVKKEIEKYGIYAKKFLSVKPGLTGNWQANGRSDTTYDERVQLDMEYVDNLSFKNDIKIILKTVISVFKGKGAR